MREVMQMDTVLVIVSPSKAMITYMTSPYCAVISIVKKVVNIHVIDIKYINNPIHNMIITVYLSHAILWLFTVFIFQLCSNMSLFR